MDGLRAPNAATAGRILYVEDSPPLLRVGRRILEREGYEVVVAEDGEQALETFFRVGGWTMVVADAALPLLTGAQLYAMVTARGFRVPFLFVSGHHRDYDGIAKEAPNGGSVGYLQKPWSADELLTAIREVLDQASSPGGPAEA